MDKDELAFQVALKTPFGVKSVRSTRKAIHIVAREWGFTEQACREIELCFSEALQNAMEHGSSGKGNVRVLCTYSPSRIKIVIEDPGAGEGDLKMLKEAFSNEREKKPCPNNERGRGIYLIRNLMDSSSMEPREGGGVRIIMTKNKA